MDQLVRKLESYRTPVQVFWTSNVVTLSTIALVWFVFAASLVAQTTGSDQNEAEQEPPAVEQKSLEPNEMPEWVEKGSFVEGEVEFVLVETDPDKKSQFAKPFLAKMSIDPAIELAVAKKIDEWFGAGAGKVAAISDPAMLAKLVPDHRRHTEVYHIEFDEDDSERFDTDSEEFFRCYAQLRFDKEFRATAESIWRRNRTRNRLIYTALIGAALLGVLGIAYGLLHFNHLTRGFYVGRLQMFAVALIVLVITISYYVAKIFVP